MERSISFTSVKHIPQRSCVACHKVKVKRELVRLVRLSGGSVEIDRGNKKSGRGAYLCLAEECWAVGLKGGRLEYSLKTKLTSDNQEQLIKKGRLILEEHTSDERK